MGVYHHTGDSKLTEDRQQISFFEALLGLVVAPKTTVETLLSEHRPRFGFTFLLLLVISIFTPIFAKLYRLPDIGQHLPALISLFSLVFVTLLLFLILEGWILIILRVELPTSILLTCIGYSFAPIVFAILITYGLNYFSSNELSLANIILGTGQPPPPGFLKLLPYIIGVSAVIAMWVFFNAIRFCSELGSVTAFTLTLVSLLPFFVSFATGLFIADRVRPGTVEVIVQVLVDPSGYGKHGIAERGSALP